MGDSILTWLIRSLHVLGAAGWVGGYLMLVVVILPVLAREQPVALRRLALGAANLVSGFGGLTIIAGLILIWRSRGYGSLLTGGEWSGNVLSAAVLAVILMGIGDSALRPALRRLEHDGPAAVGSARRWAMVGLVLSVLALLIMTRALYAIS